MLNIALTGNVASGKSTVASLFAQWGAEVIDADQLVREVQAPGTPVLLAIARHFGTNVLRPDGSLDRAQLRSRVLADPQALAELNALVHPAVLRLREARVARLRETGAKIVVTDIPLLFEVADPDAALREQGGRGDELVPEELGLVDRDDLRAGAHLTQDLGGRVDGRGLEGGAIVTGDVVDAGVAAVEVGLEHLYGATGQRRAAYAADELLALAAEHGAAHDLEPAASSGLRPDHDPGG